MRNRASVRVQQGNQSHDQTAEHRTSPNNFFHLAIYAFMVGTVTIPTAKILVALAAAVEGRRSTLSLMPQIFLALALSVIAGLYAEPAITNLRRCWVALRALRN